MQSLSALAGELSAPGLRDLSVQHSAYPFPVNELRQMQNEILDTAWAQAVDDLSSPLDPTPTLKITDGDGEDLVRVQVEWDEDYLPFGVKAPTRFVLVPESVVTEGIRDEDAVKDFLEEKHGWHIVDWWLA